MNPNKIKFIHKYGQQLDIKVVSPDLPLDRLMDAFKKFCLTVGYHPDTVSKIQYIEETDEKTN